MSDELSLDELHRQYVEVLPARTVLSTMLRAGDAGVGSNGADSIGGVDLGFLNHTFHLVPGSGAGGNGASANG